MRRMMLMVAVVALMVGVFAPAALAQETDIVGDENVVRNGGDSVEFNAVCQNIVGSVGDIEQAQYGEADAVAVDDSEATAEVSQEQGVTIEQSNYCLNDHHLSLGHHFYYHH